MKTWLLVALVAALAVLANSQRLPDRERQLAERTLEVDKFPHVFTARLTRAARRFRSIFWFGFTTWGFPRFRVQYFENSIGGVARFKFRLGLLHVAEYNDTTADFSRANIVPGSGIRLIGRGPSWSNINYVEDATTGVKSATTSLTDTNGVVEITAKVAPRAIIDHNSTLAPNKIKFDLAVRNFNFRYPTSKIAVLAVVSLRSGFNSRENKGAQSTGDQDGQDEVTVDDGNSGDGGRFAYIRQAWDTINQRAVAVKAFPLRDDDTPASEYSAAGQGGDQGDDDNDGNEVRKLVVFVFDPATRTNSILWDPELGINDNASGRVAASLAVVLFAVLAAFFGKYF
jgi:hypothetical protein